jgi:PTH2 family peptidyl-tRNA hydrolase
MADPNSSPDDLIQYFVVNIDLQMSVGKMFAQIAHAATALAFEAGMAIASGTDLAPGSRFALFTAWMDSGQRKVVLAGRAADMLRLDAAGFTPIRDQGHTEIPADSMTFVALPPMRREDARPFVKRLQVYKGPAASPSTEPPTAGA